MGRMGGGERRGALPRLLVAAILTSLLLLACQPGAPGVESGDGAAARDTQVRAAPPSEPSAGTEMPHTSSDSLRLRVEVPDRVPAGEPVRITLRVENLTERTLDLYLTGRTIAFDLVVERLDGATVWRRLEGEVIQSILRLDTLGPGEALVLEDRWAQRTNEGGLVPPGEYRVRGELLTEGELLASPAEPLRIVPR